MIVVTINTAMAPKKRVPPIAVYLMSLLSVVLSVIALIKLATLVQKDQKRFFIFLIPFFGTEYRVGESMFQFSECRNT